MARAARRAYAENMLVRTGLGAVGSNVQRVCLQAVARGLDFLERDAVRLGGA